MSDPTPGPWEISYGPTWFAVTVRTEQAAIALVPREERALEINLANAHLITASPELLDSLKEAVAMLEIYYVRNSDGTAPTITKCQAVIAKAEGKS